MLIWLPPSEGKTVPSSGAPLNLDGLLLPELAGARREVIAALQALGDGPEAAAVLGLGPKSAAEASLNLGLLSEPCAPAISLYTGVLYDNLDALTLTAAGAEALERSAWILSAAFGFVRPSDPLPPHRLAMGTKLSGIGSLSAWWRPQLAQVLPPLEGTTIVDCRPGAYRAAYPAPEAEVVEVAVAEERHGTRRIVTHWSKKWRGLAVRHLVEDRKLAADADREGVLGSLASIGKTDAKIVDVEISAPSLTKRGGSVTKVTLVTSGF